MPRVLIGEHRLKAREPAWGSTPLRHHVGRARRARGEAGAACGTRDSEQRRSNVQGRVRRGWRKGRWLAHGRGAWEPANAPATLVQEPCTRHLAGHHAGPHLCRTGDTASPRSHRRSCTEEKSSGDFANSEILHVQTRTVFSPRTCAPSGCYRVAQCAASGRMRASRPRSLALPSWLSSRP